MNLKDLMGNMGQLMETAKQHQRDVQAEGAAGGGMVTVTVNGAHRIESMTIDPAILSPPDAGLLEDLVTAAVNQAQERVNQQLEQAAMAQMHQLSSMFGGPEDGSA